MDRTVTLKQPELHRRYTRVPTELLVGDHPIWKTPATARLLLKLLAFGVCKPFKSKAHLASVAGVEKRALRNSLNQLQDLGLVSIVDGELRILGSGADDEEYTPPAELAEAVPVHEETFIAQEVSQAEKRKTTGPTQADPWEKTQKRCNLTTNHT